MSTPTLRETLARVTEKLHEKTEQVMNAGGDISADDEIIELQHRGNTLAAGLGL